MAKQEDESRGNDSPSIRGESSERDQWRGLCELAGWIVANTAMKWNDVLDLSPLRLQYVCKAIEKRRTYDKLAIFDAQAALIDEKSLNRLNRELRECQKD